MSELHPDRPGPGGPTDPVGTDVRRRLPAGAAATALVLLAVPIAVLLVVPLYARDAPAVLGFPFFYWFQLVWVVVASGLTSLAYLVVRRARQGGRR